MFALRLFAMNTISMNNKLPIFFKLHIFYIMLLIIFLTSSLAKAAVIQKNQLDNVLERGSISLTKFSYFERFISDNWTFECNYENISESQSNDAVKERVLNFKKEIYSALRRLSGLNRTVGLFAAGNLFEKKIHFSCVALSTEVMEALVHKVKGEAFYNSEKSWYEIKSPEYFQILFHPNPTQIERDPLIDHQMAMQLFLHELLHVSRIDNNSRSEHNKVDFGIAYDSVYACSNFSFPQLATRSLPGGRKIEYAFSPEVRRRMCETCFRTQLKGEFNFVDTIRNQLSVVDLTDPVPLFTSEDQEVDHRGIEECANYVKIEI